MGHANVALCDECAAIKAGQATVGRLMEDGLALYQEGVRKNNTKLLNALDKYCEALEALKNNNGQPSCISYISSEHMRLYQSIQGSRA